MCFLVVNLILYVIELVGRIVIHKRELYWLWMLYAISTPISGFIVPAAFLGYLVCGHIRQKRPVVNHETDQAHVEESDSESVPSTTSASHLLDQSGNRASETQPLLQVSDTHRSQRCLVM